MAVLGSDTEQQFQIFSIIIIEIYYSMKFFIFMIYFHDKIAYFLNEIKI